MKKPLLYQRCVDDTFVAFNKEKDCEEFPIHLNSLHPSLHFTFEKECDNCLSFLDVVAEKYDTEFVTSVYNRKPMFTGRYLRWNLFNPRKQKTSLFNTLVHRGVMIGSKGKHFNELTNTHFTMTKNGYPDHVVNSSTTRKIRHSQTAVLRFKKCPAYLHLPW